MRIRYSATHRCERTGRRYRVLGIRKWGKLYYLRDGFFDTQATRAAKAKEPAIAAGKMAWLDEGAKP